MPTYNFEIASVRSDNAKLYQGYSANHCRDDN